MNSTSNNFIKCEKAGVNLVLCGKETLCRLPTNCGKEITNTSSILCRNFYCFCPRTGAFLTREERTCEINKVPPIPAKGKFSFQLPPEKNRLNGSTKFNVYSSRTNTTKFPTTISYPNSTNFTTDSQSRDITKAENLLGVPIPAWIITAVSIVLVLLVTIVVYYTNCSIFYILGFKKKKSDENKTPPAVQLGITVMTDQRYTTNPSYGQHPGIDMSIGLVPLLSRNSITDLEKIGEGFFGEVYKGQLHSIDNEKKHVETVAIKRLKRTANQEALEDFLKEVEIISSFHHPNILTLVGVCPQENTSPPWMIFEYMSFGDLADLLRNSNPEFGDSGRDLPTLSAEVLLSISSQVAAGMEYLAAQRFVHRDLACRNCLVGSPLTVKISDFGMSRDVYTCDYYRVGGKRMLPIRWISPETLVFGKFTLESDVWSYGVVLWEIYSHGKQPYFGYTNEQAMKLIEKHILLEIPENCPNEVADIMRSCWQINPKDRIQFLDICNRLSALKECIDEISLPPLPRPPPMPVTINYPLPFDEDEFDDILDDDNYLKPASTRSSVFIEPSNSSLKPSHSNSSYNAYVEALP